MRNTPHRIRNMREARHYVAGVAISLLSAEIANGSAWIHMHCGADDGNLANQASERRAHKALQEVIAMLDAMERANS